MGRISLAQNSQPQQATIKLRALRKGECTRHLSASSTVRITSLPPATFTLTLPLDGPSLSASGVKGVGSSFTQESANGMIAYLENWEHDVQSEINSATVSYI